MNFEELSNQLYALDDRTPEQIRDAVLENQQRIDIASDAGRLVEVPEVSDKRRKGTKEVSTLPGYSRTPEGLQRGSLDGLTFTRSFS